MKVQPYLMFEGRCQEALDRVPVDKPDLVLMDIQMPLMDGLETMRRLRQHGLGLPMVAVSANTSRQDRAQALAAGANAFLSKPISREALLENVWNLSAVVSTRTVDTHVSRLRKKLDLNGSNGWRLAAIYQHGYRLEQV